MVLEWLGVKRRGRKSYVGFGGASSPNQYDAVTPPSIRKSLPVIDAPSSRMTNAPTLPNSSSTTAVPYKSTVSIVFGKACDGDTLAA